MPISFRNSLRLGVSALTLGTATLAAHADAANTAEAATASVDEIVVTAQKLDTARASIQPNLGATSYVISNQTIKNLPGADNQQLNQILLQLPGVSQDGFGQFHVRDDHNNLQYRINGTILPEGVAVFGQTLSPRLIESLNLETGALPAQYGLRTAGIVDIKTKSGMFTNGGEASIYGGSNGTIEPSLSYGGSTGKTNYFVSGSYRHNNVGIESVDGSRSPIHDKTDQFQFFTYLDHILDENDRVSFVGGVSNQHFEIPNPRGLHPAAGWSVGGQTDYLSDNLNETQLERTAFGMLSLLHDNGTVTLQSSLFARASTLDYRPDVLGELLFNGQAQKAAKRDLNVGIQIEGVYRATDTHTLRAGMIVSRDHGISRTSSEVFPVDAMGAQTGEPITVIDDGSKTEWTYSFYLQDEWKPLDNVTLNFGGRFDHYKGYRSEQQFSPRINLVVQPWEGGTLHAGYARYFSPPPFENVGNASVAKFVGTSAAAPSLTGDTPYAERQNYFDVGMQQKVGDFVTLGVDGYYRKSRNMLDEGQFGAPIILTPFNYAKGTIKGVEFNASYENGPLQLYGNLAIAKAEGMDIVSSQFSFDPADLAYIQTHYIHVDHDQTVTASAGVFYNFEDGKLAGTKVGASMIYGSGLRTDGDVPNGGKLSPYAQVNLTASHHFEDAGMTVRLDVVNALDHVYEIRDGSGIGVGAPQYGPRRGVFVGLTKSF